MASVRVTSTIAEDDEFVTDLSELLRGSRQLLANLGPAHARRGVTRHKTAQLAGRALRNSLSVGLNSYRRGTSAHVNNLLVWNLTVQPRVVKAWLPVKSMLKLKLARENWLNWLMLKY